MPEPGPITLVAYCTCDYTVYQNPADVQPVVNRVAERLNKKLARKNIQIAWTQTADNCHLFLSFREVDRGDQTMRYVLPLSGAASVSIEGVLRAGQLEPQPFSFKGNAYVGVFGGAASTMLRTCADVVAAKLARTIRKWVVKNGLDRPGP